MFGAPVGIRTPNLLIRSQMLYPLSYGRTPTMGIGHSTVPEPGGVIGSVVLKKIGLIEDSAQT